LSYGWDLNNFFHNNILYPSNCYLLFTVSLRVDISLNLYHLKSSLKSNPVTPLHQVSLFWQWCSRNCLSTDCGLYAIAMMISTAYKQDPAYVIYDHKQLRAHLKECILNLFLSQRNENKNKSHILMEEVCLNYSVCRLPKPEDGPKMVQCDNCTKWYHQQCLQNLLVSLEELELNTV